MALEHRRPGQLDKKWFIAAQEWLTRLRPRQISRRSLNIILSEKYIMRAPRLLTFDIVFRQAGAGRNPADFDKQRPRREEGEKTWRCSRWLRAGSVQTCAQRIEGASLLLVLPALSRDNQ
ncbi:hypothetical protein AK812_SmicGene33337 [Symbiodinium microadriaticum]|uniref:Uncharacterized protein n=1 Tax=Symbiodinium microadriaticum TaxID=2951 RepID=A0A1Q9CRX4_SYMMI|nr:hypothetical protein AK812_SmicGene33337 [Symbiodinium microadriaticum]CAE7320545.1 unnamed protein product [Symbiodinium microadriaticum]CAE7946985.1 unnamed protein product [Symbiodinium sp. KB8]